MKIICHFEDVDQLIAKVKAVTIKNTRLNQTGKILWGYLLLVTDLSLFLQDVEAGCTVLRKKFA